MTIRCLPPEYKLNILALERSLGLKYLTNSYKLYWFCAILDEIEGQNVEIPFRTIIDRMVAKCWYSVLKYKLNFGQQDMLHRIVYYLYSHYNLKAEAPESEILKFLDALNDDNYNNAIRELTRYVPYRFISSFYYSELRGKTDAQKNKIIKLLNLNDNNCIYKIDISKPAIIVNPTWFEYLYANLAIVQGWYKFKLINYLQRRNPNVPAVINKIEPPKKRDLIKANKFWKSIISKMEIKDIYTGKAIDQTDMSLDHFIPWSFVLHDKLWNLCPVSRITNSQKGDCLPRLDIYLDSFLSIQFKAFSLLEAINRNRFLIEDYIELGIKIDSSGQANKDHFKEVMVITLEPLHRIALNQGFELWR